MSGHPRRSLVVANWKMNLSERGSVALTGELLAQAPDDGPELAVAPSFPCLRAVADRLSGTEIRLAAQDLHDQDKGPFTGEVSPFVLAEMSVRYVLVGHSERRQHFGEDDAWVGRKAAAAHRHGIVPILCLGETKPQRDTGRTFDVVQGQLRRGLAPVSLSDATEFVVAYEPVWAIGTGDVATPAQVEEVHSLLRAELVALAGVAGAARIRILYGGSVSAENAPILLALPDVDGALVGGASLDAGTFAAIARAAK